MTLPEAYLYALIGAGVTTIGAWAMHLFVTRPLVAKWKRQAVMAALERDMDRRLLVRREKRLHPDASMPRAPNGRFTKPIKSNGANV